MEVGVGPAPDFRAGGTGGDFAAGFPAGFAAGWAEGLGGVLAGGFAADLAGAEPVGGVVDRLGGGFAAPFLLGGEVSS